MALSPLYWTAWRAHWLHRWGCHMMLQEVVKIRLGYACAVRLYVACDSLWRILKVRGLMRSAGSSMYLCGRNSVYICLNIDTQRYSSTTRALVIDIVKFDGDLCVVELDPFDVCIARRCTCVNRDGRSVDRVRLLKTDRRILLYGKTSPNKSRDINFEQGKRRNVGHLTLPICKKNISSEMWTNAMET